MDDPTRFVLVEVYRTPDDPARHKETAHYQTWLNTVAEMMAEPRHSVKYANVFPDDAGWGWASNVQRTWEVRCTCREERWILKGG